MIDLVKTCPGLVVTRDRKDREGAKTEIKYQNKERGNQFQFPIA